MPDGSQNTENWTIDNFTSVIFPFTTPVTEYRGYVLNRNLKVIPEEIVRYSPKVGTDNPTFEGRGTQFNVNTTLGLVDPGNLDYFLADGNYLQNVSDIRESENLSKNIYGPLELKMFDTNGIGNYCPDFGNELSGFKQYPIGYSTDIRGSLLGAQLGFGNAAGIDFKVPTTKRGPDGKIGEITLDDSPLDTIGKERRKIETLNRLKANAAQETLGKINLDPLGLLSGQNIISKDYSITKPKTALGKILDFASSNLLGFQVPLSILPKEIHGEGFLDDDGSKVLLDYTGSGQKTVLYSNIKENLYGPTLEIKTPKTKSGELIKKVVGPSDPPQLSGYLDETVSTVNEPITPPIDPTQPQNLGQLEFDYLQRSPDTIDYMRDFKYNLFDQTTYGDAFKTVTTDNDSSKIDKHLHRNSDNHYWDSDTKTTLPKKGLLRYTQQIVQNNEGGGRFIGQPNSDTNMTTNYGGKHKTFSQGNLVKENKGGEEDGYCRSWSVRRAYTSYGDLIRSSKLIAPANGTPNLANRDNSVLVDPGVLKIAYDKSIQQGAQSKYMLSLENLAWSKDIPHYARLPKCEQGPNGGRIMWFPPYDINFTDNTSVSWDATNFIGRAEPLYTYNHTERTGTLDFTIIVDHSSSMNLFKEGGALTKTEAEIDRFLWGCSDIDDSLLDKFLSSEEKLEIEKTVKFKDKVPEYVPKVLTNPPNIPKVYFRNARKDGVCGTTKGCKTPCIEVTDKCIGRFVESCFSLPNNGCVSSYEYNSGIDLNNPFVDNIDKLVEFLTGTGDYKDDDSGKYYTIQVIGNTSGAANKEYNEKLGTDRALSTKKFLFDKMVIAEANGVVEYKDDDVDGKIKHKSESEMENDIGEKGRWFTTTKGELNSSANNDENDDDTHYGNTDHETLSARQSRNAQIVLVQSTGRVISDIESKLDNSKPSQTKIETIKEISKTINKRLYSECDIFEEIKKEDPFIFDSLKSKLKIFHPAFHSSTPEMFNNRLTFLQQCTRQGPSLGDFSQPQNLAFGKPPICILRVGDFYHTKVAIDSLNYSFEPLQWDLNPEGIGVQPMLAKVSLSFKFIGGSSLGGPIKQLQNAVSFNFFANTSLYRPVEKFKSDKFGDRDFFYGAYGSPEQQGGGGIPELGEEDLSKRTETIVDVIESDVPIKTKEDIEEGFDDEKVDEPDDFESILNFEELSYGDTGKLNSVVDDTPIPYKTTSTDVLNVTILEDTGLWYFIPRKFTYKTIGGTKKEGEGNLYLGGHNAFSKLTDFDWDIDNIIKQKTDLEDNVDYKKIQLVFKFDVIPLLEDGKTKDENRKNRLETWKITMVRKSIPNEKLLIDYESLNNYVSKIDKTFVAT